MARKKSKAKSGKKPARKKPARKKSARKKSARKKAVRKKTTAAKASGKLGTATGSSGIVYSDPRREAMARRRAQLR